MIDDAAAERIARGWIGQLHTAPPMQLELQTARTEVHPFGWVFHYGKANPPAKLGLDDLLIGGAPFIVDRHDGSVHSLPSGLPAALCIEIYTRTGQLPKLPLRPPLDQFKKSDP